MRRRRLVFLMGMVDGRSAEPMRLWKLLDQTYERLFWVYNESYIRSAKIRDQNHG